MISPQCVRLIGLNLVVALCLTVNINAYAVEVPNFDRSVLIKTREQPVDRFITELFGRINVPVVVAPEITGTVNGDFTGSVENVFQKVAKTFYVTMYYDGSVVHVYPANQSEQKILNLPKAMAEKVMANVEQMSLPNYSNTLLKTDMGLVVSGSKRFHEQLNEITVALRKNTPRTKAKVVEEPKPLPPGDVFKIYKLRYAWAHDVVMNVGGSQVTVPGVASTLRTLIDPASTGSSIPGNAPLQTEVSNTLEKLKGQGLQNTELADGSVVLAADSKTGSRIVADSVNNAVLIRDTPERLDMYASLIKTLDVEPKMVEIEATIIDMDTDRLRELGVNWRFQGSDGEALVGNGTNSDTALQANVSQITPSGQGGILSFVLGDRNRFISRIRALETQGAARIVSKPHVMTLSNVEALLDTTSTFFVRVQGQEEVDLFNVSVGTTLRVTPHVFDAPNRQQIKLLVSIEDGTASDRLVDNIPVIDTSSINTQALVNVGESLLIGGLVREINTSTVSKVPVLGSIPGLGALFRNNQSQNSRVERLFLITPRLNLRVDGQGPTRLSVPYLSGTEGEILVSAPVRLQATREALAARDDAYSVQGDLPVSGANTQLSAKSTSSLVQRLGLNSPKTLETPSAVPQRSAPQKDPAPVVDPETEWQSVDNTTPSIAPVAAPLPTAVHVPINHSDDGRVWQSVPQ